MVPAWGVWLVRYAELQVTTHFSFLTGAGYAEEQFAIAHPADRKIKSLD